MRRFSSAYARTSLLLEILDALSTTGFAGHYHYVNMLVDNANRAGAAIEAGSRSAKQHLIPALKAWKTAHSKMTVVDANLDY